MGLDSIDVKIIEVLQENARVSISELSKRINLSLAAVSERLKKLERNGDIVQYTTILNPQKMEKGLLGWMQVGVTGDLDKNKLFNIVRESDEVLECYLVTGSRDYILKIATKDTESLGKLMNSIKSIPGIKFTETNILLDEIKLKHSVPPVLQKK